MTAPMVLDGPMDGLAFEAYLTQVLVPTLKPGDIVVIISQHTVEVGRAIQAARCPAPLSALFPRTQSDRNGLRQAQISHRKAAAKSIETVLDTIAAAVATFIAQGV